MRVPSTWKRLPPLLVGNFRMPSGAAADPVHKKRPDMLFLIPPVSFLFFFTWTGAGWQLWKVLLREITDTFVFLIAAQVSKKKISCAMRNNFEIRRRNKFDEISLVFIHPLMDISTFLANLGVSTRKRERRRLIGTSEDELKLLGGAPRHQSMYVLTTQIPDSWTRSTLLFSWTFIYLKISIN